ncbi:MAG TPA: hypothetical protein VFP69_11740, partial [Streptomyces sp.]|nr:hypothetical protein [Streptomyces sp.]
MISIWIIFGVGGVVVVALGVAVVADELAGRVHVPERLAVHIPGRYPADVRRDRARARRGWGAL